MPSPSIDTATPIRLDKALYPGDEGVLREAIATGRPIDASGCALRGLNCNGMDLRHMNAKGADLTGCSFVEANLSHANWTRARANQVDCTGATFDHACLERVIGKQLICTKASAQHVDASCAILAGSDWSQANLSHTTFYGADLRLAMCAHAVVNHTVFGYIRGLGMQLNGATGASPQFNLSDMRGAGLVHAAFTPSTTRTGSPRAASLWYSANADCADTTHATGVMLDHARNHGLLPHAESQALTREDVLTMRPLRDIDQIMRIPSGLSPEEAQRVQMERQRYVEHLCEAISYIDDLSGGRGRPRSRGVAVS
jgi:uncharacterized protein YjbI with pentapeptide repeats